MSVKSAMVTVTIIVTITSVATTVHVELVTDFNQTKSLVIVSSLFRLLGISF